MQVSHILSTCPSPLYSLLVWSCLGNPSQQSFPSKVAVWNIRCYSSSTKNKRSNSQLGDSEAVNGELREIRERPKRDSCYTGKGCALQRQMFSGWFLWTKWQQVKCRAERELWETVPVDSYLISYVKWYGSFSLFLQKASFPEVVFLSVDIEDRPVGCLSYYFFPLLSRF